MYLSTASHSKVLEGLEGAELGSRGWAGSKLALDLQPAKSTRTPNQTPRCARLYDSRALLRFMGLIGGTTSPDGGA